MAAHRRTGNLLPIHEPHDESAVPLDIIVEQYGRLVAAAVRRVVGPGGDIDDQVQETWITYLRSGHQVLDPAALGGWLFRVATRLAVRSQQRAERSVPHPDVAQLRDRLQDEEVDVDVLRGQRREVIDQAVASLRERDRRIVELLLDEAGLGYREISDRLGVPIGSVGPTRERVIRKLRSMPAVQRLGEFVDADAEMPIRCAS